MTFGSEIGDGRGLWFEWVFDYLLELDAFYIDSLRRLRDVTRLGSGLGMGLGTHLGQPVALELGDSVTTHY